VAVYRVLGASGAQSRLEVATSHGLTPLVGREQEVGTLLERWAQVQEGRGQVIILSGEAGIGKSRLLQVLQEHLAGTRHTRLECRSSPYYHDSALYPIIDLLQRVLHAQAPNGPEEQLVALEQLLGQYHLATAEAVPLLASLLAIALPDGRYAPLTLSPPQQRQKTLEALLALVFAQTTQQPVLFILEDLHWTDPSTLEWLDLLLAQVPTVPLLTLLTCRPEFQAPWGNRSYLTSLALQRFTRAQIETMVLRVTSGKTVPTTVMQHLVEKTDGVPLYVEEMTKAILESGVLQEGDGHYALTGPLTALTIPSTLQDALMARLDRLGQALALYNPQQHRSHVFLYGQNPGMACLSYDAEALWLVGYPQQALHRSHAALALAQDASHPYSLSFALNFVARLHQFRREAHTTLEELFKTHCLALLSEAYRMIGQTEDGLRVLQEALALMDKNGERFYEAEIHRLKGELLLTLPTDSQTAAEICLAQALTVARRQHAKSLELRAATSLSRLWQRQGKRTEAHELLAPIYGWFTEGFDTADLQEAKALLEELG
jgi:predicted ATPase